MCNCLKYSGNGLDEMPVKMTRSFVRMCVYIHQHACFVCVCVCVCYSETTAWEDFNGKPKKIEDLFTNMFESMQGVEDNEWLRRAGRREKVSMGIFLLL